MDGKNKFTLLLLIISFALTSSMPAIHNEEEIHQPLSPQFEQARSMWNGAKKAYRGIQKELNARSSVRRSKRQAATLNAGGGVSGMDLEILANLTCKFIIDLFRNLTNSTISQKVTQANTIRSLPHLSKGENELLCNALLLFVILTLILKFVSLFLLQLNQHVENLISPSWPSTQPSSSSKQSFTSTSGNSQVLLTSPT